MPVTKKSKYYDNSTKTGTNLYLTLPRKWKIAIEYITINEKIKIGGKVRQRDVAIDLLIKSMTDYIYKNPSVYDQVKDVLGGEI